MRLFIYAALALCFTHGSAADATPAQVLLLRHAEKDWLTGELSQVGYQRAQALAGFFQNDQRVLAKGLPVAIYASSPKNILGTQRTSETVEPLATALGLDIYSHYRKKDVLPLVAEVLLSPEYDGKTVLICWNHSKLADIAEALGVWPRPDDWNNDVFNRVWKIEMNDQGVERFSDLAQQLLPGDLKQR